MSRLVEATTEFKDENALRRAIEGFGLTLTEHGQMRKYHESVPVDLLVKFPGQYDLGFMRKDDGSLTMLCDSECYRPTVYNGKVSEQYKMWGENFDKLTEEYSANVLEDVYAVAGYSVSRERDASSGEVVLTATRG